MDEKQKQSLKTLLSALHQLNTECEKDEDFNCFIADLGIFEKSIDDVMTDLYENLEDVL